MGYLNNINIKRIEWCCEYYNTPMSEVASSCGVNLERLKKGLLTLRQLEKVANFFGRRFLFFLDKRKPTEKNSVSPKFRTISNQSKTKLSRDTIKLIEKLERHRAIYIRIYEEMYGEIPAKFNPPKTTKDIKKISTWLGLDELRKSKKKISFADYRRLIEKKGVFVFVSNSYKGGWYVDKDEKINGFSLYYENCPVIWVRKDKNRQTFTLMHELGHLLEKRDYLDAQEEEIEANNFAANLLLPKEVLAKHLEINSLPKDLDLLIEECRKLNNTLDISIQFILQRLANLKLINKKLCLEYKKRWQVDYLQNLSSSDGKSSFGVRVREKEPLQIFGNDYVKTILQSLENREITPNKACRYLDNIKLIHLRKLQESVYI